MNDKTGNVSQQRRWLLAALALGAFYSALALRLAFRAPNLVQDDARQHVFWMRRFIDPTLFPQDLIADYFQAVAPAGYKFVYWIFAKFGVDPLLLSRILPAVLGLFIAWLAFLVFMQLMPNPRGAFFASVLLGQLVWLRDDLISATPRAFVWPLFLGFVLFLLRGRVVACLTMLALEALVYPQAAFVTLGLLGLRLIKRQDRHLRLSGDRRDYIVFVAAILIFTAAILPFASSTSRYRPVITAAEACALPEFQRHGRSQFFVRGLSYWADAPRSGLFPNATPPHILLLAIAAPLCLIFARKKFRSAVLTQSAIAATTMWGTAHLFLFKLHLPARYSQWFFQIFFAMGAAATIAAVWEAVDDWRERSRQRSATFAARLLSVALALFAAGLLVYPHLKEKFPDQSYVAAHPAELYEFLRTQPKDTVIATLRNLGSLVPVFAQRSVLVSSEHAIPYHKGYYDVIRRRGQDLVRAEFTPRPEELRAFIEHYHVGLIIVGRTPLAAQDVKKLRWFGEITDRPQSAEQPALLGFVGACKVWENNAITVLDAHRITALIKP
ncbi:MAG: hypothetical protein ABR514_00235 [Chthoniobacterales bacterium]